MDTNENPRSGRGQGTSVWADDRDSTTTPPGKSKRARVRDLLTSVRGEYPVFREYRPLAIGVHLALQAALPGTSKTLTCRAVAMHCRCDNYLAAIAAGGSRYALDGSQIGTVSEEHRTAAVLVLARRSEKASAPRSRP